MTDVDLMDEEKSCPPIWHKRPLGCRLGSHTHYSERKVNLHGCGRKDCEPCRLTELYTRLERTCLLCGYTWQARESTGW